LGVFKELSIPSKITHFSLQLKFSIEDQLNGKIPLTGGILAD
jgi:hypothetical protein